MSATVAETLHVRLLGNPGLAINAAPLSGLTYSRSAALVYYLAASGRDHSREALAGLFWAETGDEQARKNLRDVLADLRRSLGPYLNISRQTVGLNLAAPIVIDSRQFEGHLETARHAEQAGERARALRAAVALYRGDFLDGLYVAQAEAFEEWMLAERERLRQLALHALHTLVTYSAEQGQYLAGMEDATRLLALDPLREESHRQLMWLLALSGQRSAALARYETLCRILDEELGLEPTDETQALYEQIQADDLAPAVPAAAPATMRPLHNLPTLLTRFVGRSAEVNRLLSRLATPHARLLTIVGPGGVGKTTLALHVARQVVDTGLAETSFTHGVCFVALASLTTEQRAGRPDPITGLANDLAARIGDALGFSFGGPDDLFSQITNYLRAKNLLLVLDNFEQILEASDYLLHLLQQAPALTMIVTSRIRLNVRGEQIVDLAGLPTPDLPEMAVPSVWDRYDALQLFRQTAEAAQPQLAWTTAEQAAAARICRLLNGLPLAIELAASMVRILPLAEIARELEQNLNLLYDARRDTPERHQNLRAIFNHSWSLLSVAEQTALRRLAVFCDGFTRPAAEYVCSDQPGAPAAMRSSGQFLALFAALVDSSLVHRVSHTEQDAAGARFHLLEMVRQYAAEQLQLATETREDAVDAVRDRHSRYYLVFVGAQAGALRGPRQREVAAGIDREIENIRDAWQWAVARGDYAGLASAAMGLFYFYEMQSWFQEGAAAFAGAAACLATLQASGSANDMQRIWAMLLAQQAWFSFHIGRQEEARALLERSLDLLHTLNRPAERIFPLNRLAAVNYHVGDYAPATALAQEALRLSRAEGDRDGEAVALTVLGQIAYLVGEYAAAKHYCRESMEIERRLGNNWGTVFNLINLGRVAYALGEYAEARRQFLESLTIRHAMADTRGIALCLNHLGETAAAADNHVEARRLYQESLALFREIGHLAGAAMALTRLGDTTLALGDAGEAARHFRQALATAQQAQALPQALAALVGIATVRIESDPGLAATLARLVEHHPAATQETRERAAHLRNRERSLATAAATGPAETAPLPQELDALIAALIGNA